MPRLIRGRAGGRTRGCACISRPSTRVGAPKRTIAVSSCARRPSSCSLRTTICPRRRRRRSTCVFTRRTRRRTRSVVLPRLRSDIPAALRHPAAREASHLLLPGAPRRVVRGRLPARQSFACDHIKFLWKLNVVLLFTFVAFSAENRYPPIARRKTRVNALMIKSGAGFFLKML
jgi:hypothetical protein